MVTTVRSSIAEKQPRQEKRRLTPAQRRARLQRLALKDIRKQQARTQVFLPTAPFRRVVKDVGMNYKSDLRWTAGAIEALQLASTEYITQMFEDAGAHCLHAKRVELQPKDIAHCFNTQRPLFGQIFYQAVGDRTVAFTGFGGYYSFDKNRETSGRFLGGASMQGSHFGQDRDVRMAWNDKTGSYPLRFGTNVLMSRAATSARVNDPYLSHEDNVQVHHAVAAHGIRDPQELVDRAEVAARAQRAQMRFPGSRRPTTGGKTPRATASSAQPAGPTSGSDSDSDSTADQ